MVRKHHEENFISDLIPLFVIIVIILNLKPKRRDCDCDIKDDIDNKFNGDCDDSENDDNDDVSNICKHQGAVSRCEAKLFCKVSQRLEEEVREACDFHELEEVIRLINSFLRASAKKEKSLAEIIKACNPCPPCPSVCGC